MLLDERHSERDESFFLEYKACCKARKESHQETEIKIENKRNSPNSMILAAVWHIPEKKKDGRSYKGNPGSRQT